MKMPKQPNSQSPRSQLRSLSDVILEFAGNVAPTFGLPPSKTSVDTAVMIWNCLFLEVGEQAAELKLIGERLRLDGPMVEINLGRLLEIRKGKYGADRRFIGKFEYDLMGASPHLSVMSAWVEEGAEPPKL
jgi:hypothetical protein